MGLYDPESLIVSRIDREFERVYAERLPRCYSAVQAAKALKLALDALADDGMDEFVGYHRSEFCDVDELAAADPSEMAAEAARLAADAL